MYRSTGTLGTLPANMGAQPPCPRPQRPMAWPGPAAILLARPDIVSIIIKYSSLIGNYALVSFLNIGFNQ